ncbi:two component system sensor kinase [Chitinimonas sp. BJB300]|uniref:two component system sensor kinase n=1 Tax=Chitinimonas sp. BJB300 TaxID=1559339 RepID=UPI000C0FBD17|nr:two component system sensor kinase [Chitinimonas sp. BJB300]PHV11489.1 hybrid sensor histidine kinase/response regulator [Chitinimonas sp. BJB300]TSJ88515.1 two component system sensor kinase [Chitinimonas sp. BJB300]
MKYPPWKTSLPFRLSLVLSAAMVLFWIITTSISLFLDFKEARASLEEMLNVQTKNRAQQEADNLAFVARDVRTLLHSWQTSPRGDANGCFQYLASEFIPPDATQLDDPLVSKAQSFVEAFGASGIGHIVDTFVLLDTGVALHQSKDNEVRRKHYLDQLALLRHAIPYRGLIWGKPYSNGDNGWRVSVGALDPGSGALVGLTVQLSKSFGNDANNVPGTEEAWLDAQNHPLLPQPPLARALSGELSRLPNCIDEGGRRINGVHTQCIQIKSTGWRFVQLYPSSRLTDEALSSLQKRLPIAVITLILLVALLYYVLQRSLGGTLQTFVVTIDAHTVVNQYARLPEYRRDELGQIARAYNHLLDAVKSQYAELEAKVAERTSALDQAKKLAERASANKSEQITSISHEIRTPLNGIVGALMLLQKTDCDGNQYDLIDSAINCSGHLLEIINNLLDFSRIESGQMVVTPLPVDLLELVDQVMLTIQAPAINKRLTLTVDIAAAFPRTLRTDGLRLRQILINLLGNAVKFTSVGEVKLSAWCQDDQVFFAVRDTGPGIPPDKQRQVFAPFQQVVVHTAGSGLGLPIAHSLAKLLGGDLRLLQDNQPGAYFVLTLPLREAAIEVPMSGGIIIAPARLHHQLAQWGYRPEVGYNEKLDAPELAYLPARLRQKLNVEGEAERLSIGAEPSPSPWSLKILVVDDVDTNRDIIGRMVRQQGHLTREASGGMAALELGRRQIFDLVLMDMRMPGLSGVETVARWRDDAGSVLDPDCPIIALTANAQPGERERLLGLGLNEYLTKPIVPAVLAQAIEFAADLQLARGIELAINAGMQVPILGREKHVLVRLKHDLAERHQALGRAIANGDRGQSLELLHSLKGLAGQAGLELVSEAAEQWEIHLLEGDALSEDDWLAFGQLIDSVESNLGQQTPR